ncbi:MAG: hypothetical protein AAFV80_23055 [Bacteroidota bacterium]
MRNVLLFVGLLFCSLSLTGQGDSRIDAMRFMQEGDHQFQSGLLEMAEASYTTAIQTDMGFAEAYMKRARLFQFMQRYSEYGFSLIAMLKSAIDSE